jgi:hypothetical protein
MCYLNPSQQLSTIKFSLATSCVRWFKGEENIVLRIIFTLVLRGLMWLGIQFVSQIHLPKPSAHGCTLATGDWWMESNVCCESFRAYIINLDRELIHCDI